MDVTNVSEIPIEQLYGHPVVQQLLNQIDLEKDIKLPYVIKDKILMSPGVWNGYFYSEDSIQDAYLKTPWDRKEARSLFLDHLDGSNGKMGSLSWIGEIQNPKLNGTDLVGDLVIVDKPTAMKLAYGAKMGISPKVSGGEEDGRMVHFKFENFSVVINPAVKTAYINNQEVEKMSDKTEKKLEEAQPVEEAASETKETVETKSEEKVEEKTETVENTDKVVDDVLSMFTEIETLAKKGGVGSVAAKAKEIRAKDPKMKWTDAIKAAAKLMQEELSAQEKDLKESQILEQAIEILALKKKPQVKKEEVVVAPEVKVEAPAKEMKEEKVTNEMSEKLDNQSKIIQELSEKLSLVESKLNEPDKVSMKSEELSQEESQDPDMAFLGTLKSM